MKKVLLLLSVFLLVGCMDDDIISPIDDIVEVPESLQIEDIQGLKVESTIVSDEVRMNIKFKSVPKLRITLPSKHYSVL